MKTKTVDSIKTLIGCFLITFLLSGTARLASLFFVEFLTIYNVDREQASLPFALAYFMRNATGPLTGYLEQLFGIKNMITFGSILATLSIAACFFAKDILTVTILWGVMYGLGFGVACQLIPLHVTRSFETNQGKAIGLSYAGCCVGGILLPPLMTNLIQVYGLSGTFLILAALIAHCIPASLVLKAPQRKVFKATLDSDDSVFDKILPQNEKSVDFSGNANEMHVNSQQNLYSIKRHTMSSVSECVDRKNANVHLKCFRSTDVEKSYLEYECSEKKDKNLNYPCESLVIFQDPSINLTIHKSIDHVVEKNNEAKLEQKSNNKTYSLRNFRIFLNPVFLAFVIINTGDTFSLSTMITIVVDFARDKEVPRNYEVYCIMCLPFADLFGRCIAGFIIDNIFSSITNLSAMLFILNAVSYLVLISAKNIILILVAEFLVGMSFGIIIIINILLVERYIEEGKKGMAMTCRLIMDAPASLCISPMIGYFRDDHSSYDPVLYILMGISLISSFIVYFIPYLSKRRRA